MNFNVLRKDQYAIESGVPIDLMIAAMKSIEADGKASLESKKTEGVMGTGVCLLVEGEIRFEGNAVSVPFKKNWNRIFLARGSAGRLVRTMGAGKAKKEEAMHVGVTAWGEFKDSIGPLDRKDFVMTSDEKDTPKANVFKWLSSGERGLSSEVMCARLCGDLGMDKLFKLAGLSIEETSHPRDPSDFKRCVDFLNVVSHAKSKMAELSSVSPEWSRLVDSWGHLEALYEQEKDRDSAPVLYAAMKQVLSEKDDTEKTERGLLKSARRSKKPC
jgi:hypothetical protein